MTFITATSHRATHPNASPDQRPSPQAGCNKTRVAQALRLSTLCRPRCATAPAAQACHSSNGMCQSARERDPRLAWNRGSSAISLPTWEADGTAVRPGAVPCLSTSGLMLRAVGLCGRGPRPRSRPGRWIRAIRSYGSFLPGLGAVSGRVQSRYLRRATDLPLGRRCVELLIRGPALPLRRLPARTPDFRRALRRRIPAPFARRTARLDRLSTISAWRSTVGRASLAERLRLPVSRDTSSCRCAVRIPRPTRSNVIGIDDLAWRRTIATAPCLRSGTSPARDAAARPRTGHAPMWLRERPSIASSRVTGAGLRPSDRPRFAARHPGRRPLAPDVECQPRLPRRRAPFHAVGPRGPHAPRP